MLESVENLFLTYAQHCAERAELGAKLCEAVKSVVPSALSEVADALSARGKPSYVEPAVPLVDGASLFTVCEVFGGARVLTLKFEATKLPPSAQMTGYAMISGRRKEIAIPLDLSSLTHDSVITLVIDQYRSVLYGEPT